MTGKNVSDDQALHQQQADAFLQAIHAPQEEKARLLQKYPELMGVVDHYDASILTHLALPPAFDEEVKSGRFEQRLAADVRNGDLKQFDRFPESHVRPGNKQYDTRTGLLSGFDLEFDANGKSMHVDVSDYLPPGASPEAARQLREDIFSMYQFGIKRNPEQAEESLLSIAKKFPQGIIWQEAGHGSGALAPSGQLIMQGTPNLRVMTMQEIGYDFIHLHDQVSAHQFKLGEDGWKEKYMAEAAADNARLLPAHDVLQGLNGIESSGPLARRHYPWPDWDSALGKPPMISLAGEPDQAYLDHLNQTLSRVSVLARNESAVDLRVQLAELGGVPINITQGLGLPRTEANVMQHEPVMQFDPAAWGRYPVEGAKVQLKSMAEPPDAPRRYGETEYGIAAPEQLLLNELGRYAMHHKAHQASRQYELTGNPDYIVQAGKFSALAQSPRYVIDHYENPAMQSLFPEFRLRDASRSGEMGVLYGIGSGFPDVQSEDQAALEFALRVHQGSNRLRNEAITPDPGKQPSQHFPGMSGAADVDRVNLQRAEAFQQGHPRDVIAAYSDLGDAYVVLAMLNHCVERSGFSAQDQMLAREQIKGNLVSSIAAGRVPTILADVDAQPPLEIA